MEGTAILLAAGQSTRMGSLKGLLPWNEKTLFEHQLQMLEKSSLSEIVVVVGYHADQFTRIAKKYQVKTYYNKNFHAGKCSSILTGLEAVKDPSKPILITAVDQPLDNEIINRLIKALRDSNKNIAVPIFNGKRGHPVLYSGSLIGELLSIKEETLGLRSVFQKHSSEVIEVPVPNSSIHLNLNTPEDYQKALKN